MVFSNNREHLPLQRAVSMGNSLDGNNRVHKTHILVLRDDSRSILKRCETIREREKIEIERIERIPFGC